MLKFFLCLFLFVGEPQEKLTYNEAYELAKKENKTLVVQVGADWCQACHRQRGLFRELLEARRLKKSVYVYVDKEEETELAEKLMAGSDGLPMTIIFKRDGDDWKTVKQRGLMSRGRLLELLEE